MPDDKKYLVIGCVHGYGFEALRPFVESLRKAGFNGDIVFLSHALPEECVMELERHGVILVPFSYRGGSLNSWSRFWPIVRPVVRLPVGNLFRKCVYRRILNLAFVRYIHALDYLEPRAHQYKGVLWADVRDVIFQDEPFAIPLAGEIEAYGEAPHMFYGNHPMNDNWILANYGQEVLDDLAGSPISCCGTVMGTGAGMVEYLREFIAEIRVLKSLAHGADTSIHNVLLHRRMKGRIRFVENLTGPVSTVGENKIGELTFTADGRVLNRGGDICPVVHQYDRHPEFVERVNKRLFSIS